MRLLARPRALLLALILLVVSVPVFAAPPTMADLETSAGRMAEFGLVKGGGSGLMLQANIDRASLMTIMVRAWQREPEALARKDEVLFPDTASSWAKGYIAVAKEMAEENGFAIGAPEGFNPTGNVTGPEVVAFLLKFMGIPRKAELNWPNDYLQAAAEAGVITEEEQGYLLEYRHVPAPRGVAFYLADKAFASYKLKSNGLTVYERLKGGTKAEPKQEPKLVISGNPAELLVGDWTHITVKAFGADGQVVENVPITVRVEGAIVSYDPGQHAITAGMAAGAGMIYADAEGYEGDSVAIAVVYGKLYALEVTPSGITLPPGGKCQIMVRGLDSRGYEVPISEPIIWRSSQGRMTADGMYWVGPYTAGAVTITARVGDVEGTAVILIRE